MANAKVRLLKSVKVKDSWVKCPVVVGKDGKHKLSRVMVAGHEEEHQLGVYHLDYRVDTIRKCVTVQGVLAATGRKGLTSLNIKASEIRLAINNIERHLEGLKNEDADDVRWSIEQTKGLAGLKPVSGQSTIAESIQKYLKKFSASDSAKNTILAYTSSLNDFEEFCRGVAPNQDIPKGFRPVVYPADIMSSILSEYYSYMKVSPPNRKSPTKKGLSATTRNGKLGHVGLANLPESLAESAWGVARRASNASKFTCTNSGTPTRATCYGTGSTTMGFRIRAQISRLSHDGSVIRPLRPRKNIWMRCLNWRVWLQ